MKKSTTNCTKTTESRKLIPETTIEATIKVTLVIKDQLNKDQALDILKDMVNDQPDAFGNEPLFDQVEYKDIKVFQREV